MDCHKKWEGGEMKMTLEEYRELMTIASNAANKALDIGDFETHMEWGRAFHKLGKECLAAHEVELRYEFIK